MIGYLPRLVLLGFQPWGIWNCTYICPIMIDALGPAVELVAYIVVLGTPPTKKLPWSFSLSGPLVKAPSLPFPSACADALAATIASSRANDRRTDPATITATRLRKTHGLGMPITANRGFADLAVANLTCYAERADGERRAGRPSDHGDPRRWRSASATTQSHQAEPDGVRSETAKR